MANILVAFPKAEDARNIRNILTRNGFRVLASCTSGAQVLNYAEELNEAIVVCGFRLPDMTSEVLLEYLPDSFHMLLIASSVNLDRMSDERMMAVSMPLRMHDLLETLSMLEDIMARKRRKRRNIPKTRNEEEQKYIDQAKHLLMERNHMTEEEAHRYIQKCSMDSGTNLVETSRMILQMM